MASSTFLKYTAAGLAIIGMMVSTPLQAQDGGLFNELFGPKSGDTKKKSPTRSTSSKKKSSTRSTSSSSSRSKSSSSSGIDFLTALSGKTPEERAREEAARRKAAAAKAKEDARKKAIAAAARKKADEEKARIAATKDREKARQKAIDDARKKKAAEERAEMWAEKRKADEARRKALAEKRIKDERARQLVAQAREREMARRRAEEDRIREQRRRDAELISRARGRNSSRGGGLFSFRGPRSTTVPASFHVQSPPGRYLYLNEREIGSLNSSNSRIEIDLSDQRARVYRGSVLVIETQISTGRAGFRTPTGRYSVKEKLVEKTSGRYGTWYNSSGVQLRGDDRYSPPPGASRFVGAPMPYWLRITGGIGMHIGYVPDGPASHGCIRVPSNIQPLIYSKVRVGTPVRIKG